MDWEKNLHTPEFVPYYIMDVKKFEMKPTEAIVYWFIRFYAKTWNTFSWSDEDLATVLHLAKWTIWNCISSLNKKWAIKCDTKRYMTWSNRKITLPVSLFGETHLINQWGAKSPNDEVLPHQTVTSNKEIIKEKNKDIKKSKKYNKKNYNKTDSKEMIDFESFWKEYPKSWDKYKSFVAFCNSMNDWSVSLNEIIIWAKWYARYVLAENTEKKWIKNWSTWLNWRHWEDDYTEWNWKPKRDLHPKWWYIWDRKKSSPATRWMFEMNDVLKQKDTEKWDPFNH